MSELPVLKQLVKKRLEEATEDICRLFERTTGGYEDQLSRLKEDNRKYKLLDAAFNPEVHLHRLVLPADVQQLLVIKEKILLQWSPSLDQDHDPDTLHIKAQEEELWTSPVGEQLNCLKRDDISRETETPSSISAKHIKTGTEGEECAGLIPARNLDPKSLLQSNEKDSDSSETEVRNEDDDDDDDWQKPLSDSGTESEDSDNGWEETSEPELRLNGVKYKEAAVSDVGCNNDKKSFCSSECDEAFVCGKRFTQLTGLKKHAKIHTGEKLLACDACGKRFTQLSSLKRHTRIHTGEKPFGCDTCGKRFTQLSNLKKHTKIHTGEKPFGCDTCGRRFTELSTLRKHTRVHTGEKPFGCDACGKRFAHLVNLKKHTRVHTGEKPFGCDTCGKRFADLSTLRRHTRIHTGEKPFGCDACGKRFAHLGNLKRHTRVHTGEKPRF